MIKRCCVGEVLLGDEHSSYLTEADGNYFVAIIVIEPKALSIGKLTVPFACKKALSKLEATGVYYPGDKPRSLFCRRTY